MEEIEFYVLCPKTKVWFAVTTSFDQLEVSDPPTFIRESWQKQGYINFPDIEIMETAKNRESISTLNTLIVNHNINKK